MLHARWPVRRQACIHLEPGSLAGRVSDSPCAGAAACSPCIAGPPQQPPGLGQAINLTDNHYRWTIRYHLEVIQTLTSTNTSWSLGNFNSSLGNTDVSGQPADCSAAALRDDWQGHRGAYSPGG